MSERDRSRGAELRAERIRWRGRSRNMNQASRSMDEHLRKMKDQGRPWTGGYVGTRRNVLGGTRPGTTRRGLASAGIGTLLWL